MLLDGFSLRSFQLIKSYAHFITLRSSMKNLKNVLLFCVCYFKNKGSNYFNFKQILNFKRVVLAPIFPKTEKRFI